MNIRSRFIASIVTSITTNMMPELIAALENRITELLNSVLGIITVKGKKMLTYLDLKIRALCFSKRLRLEQRSKK